MNRIGVLHLTDSLAIGGTERVAVNLANLLPRDRFRSYLCATREEGPLASLIKPDVGRLSLERRRTLDWGALERLGAFIAENRIQILHAHSTSLLLAALASLRSPFARVIWHDHYGNHDNQERPAWVYRLLARRVGGVIAVNQTLAGWARQRLRIPADRVRYVPNFVAEAEAGETPPLPGQPGRRIICVANLRPQKDHFTLLRAMDLVRQQEPAAHLLLVGSTTDQDHCNKIKNEISRLALDNHVSLLGEQQNVAGWLGKCDIGVLSSASEGLPLALLEYGGAGLAAVATEVGQCAEVLDGGRDGMLVAPGAPDQLAAALIALLRAPAERAAFGERFRRRVSEAYSPQAALAQICQIYDAVLESTVPRV
jgi:glycosyltransferase involved in cell wall biosynthesis